MIRLVLKARCSLAVFLTLLSSDQPQQSRPTFFTKHGNSFWKSCYNYIMTVTQHLRIVFKLAASSETSDWRVRNLDVWIPKYHGAKCLLSSQTIHLRHLQRHGSPAEFTNVGWVFSFCFSVFGFPWESKELLVFHTEKVTTVLMCLLAGKQVDGIWWV